MSQADRRKQARLSVRLPVRVQGWATDGSAWESWHDGPTVFYTRSNANKSLKQAPPRPSEVAPGISADLEEIALKLLSKRPEDRYQKLVALTDCMNHAPDPTTGTRG